MTHARDEHACASEPNAGPEMSLCAESGAGSDPAENALVARAIAGDRDAASALWNAHRRWVAAVLLSAKPREIDLEDMLQIVATTLVATVGDLRDPGAFKPWLRRLALNAARAAGRRATVRRKVRLAGDTPPEPTTHAAEHAHQDEGRRLLELARDLPEGYAEPLLLRCVQGMSYRQISAVTGLPETTIETRIARGRRMLRERAAEDRAFAAMTNQPDQTDQPQAASREA